MSLKLVQTLIMKQPLTGLFLPLDCTSESNILPDSFEDFLVDHWLVFLPYDPPAILQLGFDSIRVPRTKSTGYICILTSHHPRLGPVMTSNMCLTMI